MNSSRQTTIGIALILMLFFGWMLLHQPEPKPTTKPSAQHLTQAADSLAKAGTVPTIAPNLPYAPPSDVVKTDSTAPLVVKKIETPLVLAEVSSKGGTISSWVLKNYLTWDKKRLNLVDQATKGKSG